MNFIASEKSTDKFKYILSEHADEIIVQDPTGNIEISRIKVNSLPETMPTYDLVPSPNSRVNDALRGRLIFTGRDLAEFFTNVASYCKNEKPYPGMNVYWAYTRDGVNYIRAYQYSSDVWNAVAETESESLPPSVIDVEPTTMISTDYAKEPITRKQEFKREQKALYKNKKWEIGATYILKSKRRDGSDNLVKEFVLKKFIWTEKLMPVNVLIMKQVSGPCNNLYTLNKFDCQRYHIKFEPGLQVWSMEHNFIKKRA